MEPTIRRFSGSYTFNNCAIFVRRYTFSPGVSDLTDSLKQGLRDKVPAGSGVNAVVLKLFFNNADFTGEDFTYHYSGIMCYIKQSILGKYFFLRILGEYSKQSILEKCLKQSIHEKYYILAMYLNHYLNYEPSYDFFSNANFTGWMKRKV